MPLRRTTSSMMIWTGAISDRQSSTSLTNVRIALIARVVSAFETSVGRLLPQLRDAHRGGVVLAPLQVGHHRPDERPVPRVVGLGLQGRGGQRDDLVAAPQAGVTAVSQTAGPETVLCGEAELPYGLIGYATDYANGVQDEATPVEELVRFIGASTATFAATLAAAVPALAAAAPNVAGAASAVSSLPWMPPKPPLDMMST